VFGRGYPASKPRPAREAAHNRAGATDICGKQQTNYYRWRHEQKQSRTRFCGCRQRKDIFHRTFMLAQP